MNTLLKNGDKVFHPQFGRGKFSRYQTNPKRAFCEFPHNKKKGMDSLTPVLTDEINTVGAGAVYDATEFFTTLGNSAKAQYLTSNEGLTFIQLLRKHEHTMYAKVRYPEKFFAKYKVATGIDLTFDSPGLLHSQQGSKWGDELTIRFTLNGYEPSFPHLESVKGQSAKVRPIVSHHAAEPRLVTVPLEDVKQM